MTHYRFDVVIIGAGPAGLTAAGALAGTGLSVALLEAGVYAGAENWSGCVYFAESLAAQDCFGREAVAASPYERRVVRRGTLMHNGLDVVGLDLTDEHTFQNCYTVLRPVFDPYFADLARRKGAVHLTGTTVTALIRKNGRVVGVETNRGPLYADVTFIAEGDASHLVRSEQLERVAQPHFLQGVKAVLSLAPEEIEQRFNLKPAQGAAYEILIRNASIAGRTAKLNAGGFLYTNRDSLSVGYVAPLDNIRDSFRGRHDALYEWMLGLPYIKELTAGAKLSAYGTKIIRSGGWHERPLLVQDGLAVGSASSGLGVDIPFPNFTGPASATGLYFARAVRNILKRGGSFDAGHLTREYLTPLRESVYGRNAEYLSAWPRYFGRSKVLFSRTADVVCGTAHFLSTGSYVETGRFLRSHILSVRGIRELGGDTSRAISALRLWNPILTSLINPANVLQWIANLFRRTPARRTELGIVLRISGTDVDAAKLPWPISSLVRRLSSPLAQALEQVYANDDQQVRIKFHRAVRHLIRGFRLTDLLVLPVFGITLLLISLGTAVWDAFRFYVLKTPVDKLLAEPVMAYTTLQKRIRDLDNVKASISLDAKLATNTYRVGSSSHIRTLWPESIAAQPEMARAGLWWVCPARVYVYDPPPFAGRGSVTVNFENCIKCESCWRAEPDRVLWGRHTDHRLIYRPDSAASARLMQALKAASSEERSGALPAPVDDHLWYLSPDILRAAAGVIAASAAFRDSVAKLPASADKARKAWPIALGRRLVERLTRLETACTNDARQGQVQAIQTERKALEQRIAEGRLFHAVYCCRRIEERLDSWSPNPPSPTRGYTPPPLEKENKRGFSIFYQEVSALFPDRIVKQWEDQPMPEEWADKLRTFIEEHRDSPFAAVRALSSVNPALGLIAAHQICAARILTGAGLAPDPGVCAVNGDVLKIEDGGQTFRIKGTLDLVPVAASRGLLIISKNKGYVVPITTRGMTITPTPAIGFRAAGLAEVTLDCAVNRQPITASGDTVVPDPISYLSIALGAADYLSTRVKEHASGRVQFPGQMLDTGGRDGIAKLGAVKAMISRVEAWRLLLERLYEFASHSALRTETRPDRVGDSAFEFNLLCSAIAAHAFGPEPGTMGYDAGQVFGGFAYSEDDLLSRFYRDSALFGFLAPGYGSAARLNGAFPSRDMLRVLPGLGNPDSVRGEPLGHVAARLSAITNKCASLSPADARLAGTAKALATGIRGLLVSIEQDLNRGRSSEADAFAAEVLLALAEDAVIKAEMSAGRGTVSASAVFPMEPLGRQAQLESDYDSFCAAPGAPHKSGTFLLSGFDRSSRFVPEMQLHDPKLRSRWADLVAWFKKNCSNKQFEGLHIERYIEKNHRLPGEIVQAAKENKWLATYIPESLDGLGWHKAEYYILNSAAGSFGDAAIDLLIMASTSIGTTPILLGLEEELPRVREELAPLVQDEGKLGEIGSRLDKIIRTLSSPNPAWIKKEYEAVMKLVDDRIRRTRVAKYLAANFLRAFYGAGIAGRRGDFTGFISNLKHAGGLFANLMPDVRAALDELPRRERCHKLFLRYLGHGAVSAFALTEPTAGSDSGGVRTTAKLLKAKLTKLDDGRYSFYANGSDQKNLRYLIDADKIVFTDHGIAYTTPDDKAQQIRYDKYDYATDLGVRYYLYNGKECVFHDIGQVRESGDGLFYEYYGTTGAKMWITNGSIATQFCLYAQTPEGVTGLMVDRHAEGLKVGADEKKTGQRGSPTNEISIDNVRVPREAVIGYEGHGQVNALETLNVGRCGLAVVSGALMRKLMQEANATIPPSPERDRLLGEAAAVLFGSESLAYYLVGLFDRPHESVRMESAIAKYVCSEDIHELISLVEYAYGPAGQTEKFLLEKARRDSRILTIYEGTNEVQRFLILKDLIAMAPLWPEIPGGRGDAAGTLAEWKNRLRKHVKEAASLLGDTCWSDAMLQPALFPLSEMAGEILKLECIYYRLEWLDQRSIFLNQGLPDYVSAMAAAGRRAADRCLAQLKYLDEKYAAGWEQLKTNMNKAEVRAADAALDLLTMKRAPAHEAPGILKTPLRVLSIIRPVADLSPRPRIAEGEVSELVWRIDPSDLAGLSAILEIKSASDGKIVVDVLMPGGPELDSLIRINAGTQADALLRLDIEPAAGPQDYARAVKDLEEQRRYDLIITGAACSDGDRSLGAYLAGNLRKNHYRKAAIEVKPDGTGLDHVVLPAVLSITAVGPERTIDMCTAVSSAFADVQVIAPAAEADVAAPRFDHPAGAEKITRTVTDSGEAAEYIRSFAAAESAASAREYQGQPKPGSLKNGEATWAILDPQEQKSNLAVLRAAIQAGTVTGRKTNAVIPAPRHLWPQLLGLAEANGCEQAFCLDTQKGRMSNDGKRELIRALFRTSDRAIIFAGSEWAGSFAYVAGEAGSKTLLCSGITGIGRLDSGALLFSLPVYDGRLVRTHVLDTGSAFITVASEADLPASREKAEFKAMILDLAVKPDWIMPLPPLAPPTLSQADVIIDLGYGIKDQTGFALAQELKKKLESLGLAPLFGATRKVTQDLKLLPLEAQIGQTGVRVNPKLIIALGISGAPQHIDYIGTRAEILCFNKDSEAPLMKLNQARPTPRVHPILGDLFVTVRELMEKL